jgi:hypothetical protein
MNNEKLVHTRSVHMPVRIGIVVMTKAPVTRSEGDPCV